jgi:YD repeat-containing protein
MFPFYLLNAIKIRRRVRPHRSVANSGLVSCICLCAAFAPPNGSAQISSPPYADNILTPASPIGTPPGASTDGDNESINLSSGALTIYVPLLSVPQRGGWNLPFALINSSNGYYLRQNVTAAPLYQNQDGQVNSWTTSFAYTVAMFHPDAAFEINLPRLQASEEYAGSWNVIMGMNVVNLVERQCLTNFAFTDWAGNKHPLALTLSCNQPNLATPPFVPGNIADATDGSSYRLDLSNIADVKVISKSGTVYHFYGMSNPYPTVDNTSSGALSNYENWYDQRLGLMTDTNGNSISVALSGSSYVVTDTIGRQYSISASGSNYTLSYKGGDGGTKSISENLAITGSAVADVFPSLSCTYSPRPNGSGPNPPGTCSPGPAPGYSSYQATITYPAADSNGISRKLSVALDSRERVIAIDYPSGGYTKYDYTDASVEAWSPTTITHYTFQSVLRKRECPSSSGSCSAENLTTYSGTIAVSDGGAGQPYFSSIKVTDPVGNTSVHSFAPTLPGQISPKEIGVTVSDVNYGTLWSRQTTYTSLGSFPISTDLYFPHTVTTTLSDGQPAVSSTVTYTYETYPIQITGGSPGSPITTYIDNPTEIDETDFDGTIKRKTTEQWDPLGYFPGSGGHILDRPASKTIADEVKGLQNTTTYVYDNGSATVGNLTQTTVTATNAPSSVTHYQVNGYGQVTQLTDPDSHITKIYYSDAWADSSCSISSGSSAYPSSITNTAGETVAYTYNTCLGTITSESGPNANQITSYSYDDLQRVVSMSLPDHGGKKACYFDSVPNSITTYTLQTLGSSLPTCSTPNASPSGLIANSTLLDGFSRKLQAQLLSDPSGKVLIDTAYDPNGNVASMSTPYRSSGELTYGATGYQYDALRRKRLTTNPDQTSQRFSYSGRVMTSTDENGSKWQRTTDALGNLVTVLEPNGSGASPSMETDYAYDGFGNLRSVAQYGGAQGASGARNRAFTYSGISQLLTSYNPETGTVCYGTLSGSSCTPGYDPAGNLISRTDARGIKVSFSYDSVNRLIGKSYSDGTSTACYQYGASAIPYGIGKLSKEWTQASTVCTASPTSFLTMRFILAYDPMGRPLSEEQYTVASQASATVYKPAFTYDLAGNLLTSTNGITITPGVNTVSFANFFDGAGRLSSVTSNWSDSTHPATLFAAQALSPQAMQCQQPTSSPYFPFGALANAVFGNGIALSRTYDKRLRVSCEIDAVQ